MYRNMAPKIYTLLAAVLLGAILLALTEKFIIPSDIQNTQNTIVETHKGDNIKTQKETGENTFSNEEMLYLDTGIGDKDKLYPRLVQYLKKRISVPRKHKPANQWPRKDFSQFGRSKELEKFLGSINNGFFIECGAHDGLVDSNTAFLELTKNWTGILIEGDPRVYLSMLNSGRNAYMLPHCISPVDKPFRANFRVAGGFKGLTDFFRLHQGPDPNTLKETLVTCYPFNAIMEALGVYHIDFFTLDVEGAEHDVLQTMDFKKFKIDLILIEYAYTPLDQKQAQSAVRSEKYRALFNATGLYKEVGIFTFDGTNLGLDVAFQRINN